MTRTILKDKSVAYKPTFETKFSIALSRFSDSPFNDEGAALAALRRSGLRCKRSTEKVLANLMAWFVLKLKSERGVVNQDATELFMEAFKEYQKRELSFWRLFYW